MRWQKVSGTGCPYGERTGAYGVSVGTAEGKRPLGRPRSRLKDKTKMYYQEVRWES